MLGVAMPLVQAAQRWRSWIFVAGAFAAGAVIGSFSIGLITWGIGSQLQRHVPESSRYGLVGVVGLLLLAADTGIGRLRTPSLMRQTSPHFFQRLGPVKAFVLWGIDIGLGFSTIRVTSLYWFALAAAMLAAPPRLAPALLGMYGVGLSAALAVFAIGPFSAPHESRAVQALRAARGLKDAAIVALAVLAVLFVVAGICA
jgi:hypothetical protein